MMAPRQSPQLHPMPPSAEFVEGAEEEDVHEVADDDSNNEVYDQYEEDYEGMYPAPQQPQSQPVPMATPGFTGLICPLCRVTIQGRPHEVGNELKKHLAEVHDKVDGPSNSQQHSQDDDAKKFSCHICDKFFKHPKGVRDHIKRIHKVSPQAPNEPHPDDPEGMMMDPQHPEMNPSPGKKKGRPRKNDQARPVGQVFGTVQGTPRQSPHDLKDGHEQSRPPVQQERGASPAMAARQRPQGIMSPSSAGMMSPSQSNAGMMPASGPPRQRSMGPQNIMGPGMRPRGPHPQQFQHPHPQMDIRKLGKKLGGAISITSSDQQPPQQPPQQPSMRRPMPSTSRMHTSSPKSDPLATPGGRPPSITSQRLSQDPVEVKEEPMEDFYEGEGEEDMPEDYDDEDGEGYAEDEEEEDDEQDYGQEVGMYPGEAPDDDYVEHDDGAYQQ